MWPGSYSDRLRLCPALVHWLSRSTSTAALLLTMASTARKGQGAGPTTASLQASTTVLKRSAKEARLAEPKPKRQRTKAGCITCRVRGKVSLALYFLIFRAPFVTLCADGQSTRRWALRPSSAHYSTLKFHFYYLPPLSCLSWTAR